ncbi:acyl-CoA dehydrogenase family protein [Streptomyces sp. NPDC096311]|uniref:acyl-CoA dehydrogenase family protein n=1 Tax=Streptomyces sp. NPDC096311 TaxID=3366083 RepID=UPI003810193B
MDLLPSSDQLELVAVASEFCREQLPVSAIRDRQDEPTAITRKLWSAAAELGLLGVSASEESQGLGLQLDDEVLLFRELGRRLVPGPLVSSVLGARVAMLAGRGDLARSIVVGETLVGLARRRDGVPGDGGPVSGGFDFLDATDAEYVLVVEPGYAGLVETERLGGIESAGCIDPGTRLATAVLDEVSLSCWVPTDDDPVRLRGLVLASALQAGIAEAVRDQAVEHACNRVQFGRAIGVNQAIKHACADMAVAAEAAWQQTVFAAVSLSSALPDAEFQVLAAKTVAGRAAIDGAEANIQIHGGMGFTDEHDAHLYLKRARVLDQFFGSPRDHLKELLAQEVAS